MRGLSLLAFVALGTLPLCMADSSIYVWPSSENPLLTDIAETEVTLPVAELCVTAVSSHPTDIALPDSLASMLAVACSDRPPRLTDPVHFASCSWLGPGLHVSFAFVNDTVPRLSGSDALQLSHTLKELFGMDGWDATLLERYACTGDVYCSHRSQGIRHTSKQGAAASVNVEVPFAFTSHLLESALPPNNDPAKHQAEFIKSVMHRGKHRSASLLLSRHRAGIHLTATQEIEVSDKQSMQIPRWPELDVWLHEKESDGQLYFRNLDTKVALHVRHFMHVASSRIEVTGTGMHRLLENQITLPAGIATRGKDHQGDHIHCVLAVAQPLPSTVFVDPHEMDNKVAASSPGTGAVVMDKSVDLEASVMASTANQLVVYQMHHITLDPLSDYTFSSRLPIHVRYLRPTASGGFATFSVPSARLSLSCKNQAFKDGANSMDSVLHKTPSPKLLEQSGMWFPLAVSPDKMDHITVPVGSLGMHSVTVAFVSLAATLGALVALRAVLAVESSSVGKID